MTDEAITFYARKCFGHLPLKYGRLCVLAALQARAKKIPA